MNKCPVFTAYDICERVELEIEQLCESFKSKLVTIGIQIGKSVEEYEQNDNHYMHWYWSDNYEVIRVGKSRKRRAITLHFNMCRDASEISIWPHAREALLIIAYTSAYAELWDADQLAVDSSGFPASQADLQADPIEPRILVWQGKRDVSWTEKDWLYAIPLLSIENSDAIDRELVNPLKKLLIEDQAKTALASTHAIHWPPIKNSDEAA